MPRSFFLALAVSGAVPPSPFLVNPRISPSPLPWHPAPPPYKYAQPPMPALVLLPPSSSHPVRHESKHERDRNRDRDWDGESSVSVLLILPVVLGTSFFIAAAAILMYFLTVRSLAARRAAREGRGQAGSAEVAAKGVPEELLSLLPQMVFCGGHVAQGAALAIKPEKGQRQDAAEQAGEPEGKETKQDQPRSAGHVCFPELVGAVVSGNHATEQKCLCTRRLGAVNLGLDATHSTAVDAMPSASGSPPEEGPEARKDSMATTSAVVGDGDHPLPLAMRPATPSTHGEMPDPEALRECPVCLVDYEPGDIIKWVPECGHAFHGSCLVSWLRARGTCPLCRQRAFPGLRKAADTEHAGTESQTHSCPELPLSLPGDSDSQVSSVGTCP